MRLGGKNTKFLNIKLLLTTKKSRLNSLKLFKTTKQNKVNLVSTLHWSKFNLKKKLLYKHACLKRLNRPAKGTYKK